MKVLRKSKAKERERDFTRWRTPHATWEVTSKHETRYAQVRAIALIRLMYRLMNAGERRSVRMDVLEQTAAVSPSLYRYLWLWTQSRRCRLFSKTASGLRRYLPVLNDHTAWLVLRVCCVRKMHVALIKQYSKVSEITKKEESGPMSSGEARMGTCRCVGALVYWARCGFPYTLHYTEWLA